MKRYLLLICISITILSCEEYDQDILPVVGVYEANLVGSAGPFSVSILSDVGDDILIEAPFDGDFWSVIDADIDDKEEDRKFIDIREQEISPGEFISGNGVYFDNSIQLEYTIDFRGRRTDYYLVGSKL